MQTLLCFFRGGWTFCSLWQGAIDFSNLKYRSLIVAGQVALWNSGLIAVAQTSVMR